MLDFRCVTKWKRRCVRDAERSGVRKAKNEGAKKMFRKSLLTMLMAGVAAIALPAYAQSDEAARQDVAVQAFGSFVTTSTHNGIDNSATNSGGVLATYRYFFSTHHGV